MATKLTDRHLKSIKAPATGRTEISDSVRSGLRFRIIPSGRATWIFEKRIKGGPKRTHTLGTWPELSLTEAREVSLELTLEAQQGIDRVTQAADDRANALLEAARQAARRTVGDVLEVYDKRHLSHLRTGAQRHHHLLQALAPVIGLPAEELASEHLRAPIDAKTDAGRLVFANRLRAALLAFSKWAWQAQYTPEDVGQGIPKPHSEEARDRVLTLDEVHAVWAATCSLTDPWGPMVRALLLTGQRLSEIMKLRWDEVDLDAATITKSGRRAKNRQPHITHLSAPVLADLRKLEAEAKSPEWVFSATGRGPLSSAGKLKVRLDALLPDDMEHWVLHDFRTAMATALAEAGEAETVVDRILNHGASGSAPSQVARVYNRSQQLTQRAIALNRWAGMVTGQAW